MSVTSLRSSRSSHLDLPILSVPGRLIGYHFWYVFRMRKICATRLLRTSILLEIAPNSAVFLTLSILVFQFSYAQYDSVAHYVSLSVYKLQIKAYDKGHSLYLKFTKICISVNLLIVVCGHWLAIVVRLMPASCGMRRDQLYFRWRVWDGRKKKKDMAKTGDRARRGWKGRELGKWRVDEWTEHNGRKEGNWVDDGRFRPSKESWSSVTGKICLWHCI